MMRSFLNVKIVVDITINHAQESQKMRNLPAMGARIRILLQGNISCLTF